MIRETAERIVVVLAWEDVTAGFDYPSPFQKLQHRQPDGPGGGSLLTFDQTQAARCTSINDQFPTDDSPKHLKVLETLVKNGSGESASFRQPNR